MFTIKKTIHSDGLFYLVWYSDIGLEEDGDGNAVAKKCPVDTFLVRGRVLLGSRRSRMAVDGSQSCERYKLSWVRILKYDSSNVAAQGTVLCVDNT